MDNKIDELLYDIGSETPKVNPYLGNKIYNTAKSSKTKNNIPFFKKPLIISFASIIVVFLFIGIITFDDLKNKFNDNKGTSGGNEVVNPFVPTLSPSTQSTVFLEYHYTVYTTSSDIVTLIINNRINYQRIYLKAYNLTIDDIKINNGDASINQVTIEDQVFFEIIFNNKNTTIHYIDLCFAEGTIEKILKSTKDYELEFIMYIEEVDAEKGYGYNFNIEEVYNLREGNNV